MLSLEDNPKMSLAERKQFLPEDISKSSLHRILKQEKIKPYKLMYTQELLEDDPDRRCEFSEMMINKINNDPDFKNKILFSDESTFCLNGEVNRHNCRFWSKTNPHWMEPLHTQRPQKVNVWAGIVKDKIIGPFFIEGNLNSQKYLQILRGKVVPKLIELNINVNEIWFQQDGAPPHFARTVREFLDEVFPGRWIGRRGSIEWPARSPDLTPMDFFYWGHLKNKVFKNKSESVNQLKEKIIFESRLITPLMLENTLSEFYNRLGYCLSNNGQHFENLI